MFGSGHFEKPIQGLTETHVTAHDGHKISLQGGHVHSFARASSRNALGYLLSADFSDKLRSLAVLHASLVV